MPGSKDYLLGYAHLNLGFTVFKETNFAFIIRHKFRYTYCISRIDINLREIIDSRACMVRMHMRGDQRNRLIRDGSTSLSKSLIFVPASIKIAFVSPSTRYRLSFAIK